MAEAHTLEFDRPSMAQALRRMDARVWELGLQRFDPNDVPSHPMFLWLGRGRRRYVAYPLKFWELHAPRMWRMVLAIKPQLVPTTIFHVGMSHLHCAALAADEWPAGPDRLATLTALALETRLAGEHLCWAHPYDSHGAVYRDGRASAATGPGLPASCAHHTARLGLFLQRTGVVREDASLLAAARSAATAMLRYHNWHEHGGGTATVSYYPDTNDEVINTAADVALLLAAVAAGADPPQGARERAASVVRLLVNEQRADGGWSYTTRRHDEDARAGSDTDNHHHAMIVAALAEMLSEGLVEKTIRAQAEQAVARGLRYYLDAFCRREGLSLAEPTSRREAPVAGYAEGVRALLASLRALPDLDAKLVGRTNRHISSSLQRAHRAFLNPDTGDVACYRRLGVRYDIGSIRWGAGLLMEATAEALAWPRVLPLVAPR